LRFSSFSLGAQKAAWVILMIDGNLIGSQVLGRIEITAFEFF
jgi:hypothetical protein